MDFIQATGLLKRPLRDDEIAEQTGVSVQTIRQARLDPGNPNHRPAPAGWEGAVARLARERSKQLAELAEEIEPPAG